MNNNVLDIIEGYDSDTDTDTGTVIVEPIDASDPEYIKNLELERACAVHSQLRGGLNNVVRILNSLTRPLEDSQALYNACNINDLRAVQLLLTVPGVLPTNSEYNRACRFNNVEMVRSMLWHPNNCIDPANDSRTFIESVKSGNFEVVQWLVNNKLVDPLLIDGECIGLRKLYRNRPDIPQRPEMTQWYLDLPGVYNRLTTSNEDPGRLHRYDPVRAMYSPVSEIPDRHLASKIQHERRLNLERAHAFLEHTSLPLELAYHALWLALGDGGLVPRGVSKNTFISALPRY